MSEVCVSSERGDAHDAGPTTEATAAATEMISVHSPEIQKSSTRMIVIHAADHGLQPDSQGNSAAHLRRLLDSLTPGSRLVVAPGVYHLRPEDCVELAISCSNTAPRAPRRFAITLQDRHDVELDLTGVELRCHGQMTPIAVLGCSQIRLIGGSIDWDQPLTAEAEVLATSVGAVEIAIDPLAYPHRLADGRLEFLAHGYPTTCWGVVEFERGSGDVAPGSGDDCLATTGWKRSVWQVADAGTLSDGRQRWVISGSFIHIPGIGSRLMLRHGQRNHPGILIAESSAIRVVQLSMHHNGGLGILCQFSRDLSFVDCRVVPSRGRCFSGKDDGLQCSNCAGAILVDGCVFSGLADDPINIHGTVLRIEEILAERRLRLRLVNHESLSQDVVRVGDEVCLLDRRTMADRGLAIVTAVKRWSDADVDIELDRPLPAGVQVHDAVESRTWTPAATISDCRFEPGRGRGILVSTPRPVVIRRSHFRTAGSAILIAGDANFWYESGAVRDVVIEDNDFAACCNANDYQFGEAVISIHPEIPHPELQLPYHRGICIRGNRFALADHAVIAAFSVAGLEVRDNRVNRDGTRSPRHAERPLISLKNCPDAVIVDNHLDPALPDHRLRRDGIDTPIGLPEQP